MNSPKANPERLMGIITDARAAKIVVPDFQRPFVWSREDIEQLLVSILRGYFIGTFLLLDTPTDHPLFPFRPVEGLGNVDPSANPGAHNTVRLVLDGQQRITSLFYALFEPKVPLKWAEYPHKFYLRLEEALRGEVDEAVVGISTRDRYRMAEMDRLVNKHVAVSFPLMRDTNTFLEWLYNHQTAWPPGQQRQEIAELHQSLQQFMVPIVSLPAGMSKFHIVNIFERINRTGVTLSFFDLMAARLYPHDIRLHELWNSFKKTSADVAAVVKPEAILKVMAIAQGYEPRNSDLLDALDSLNAQQFRSEWDAAAEALSDAYNRIAKEYGAFTRTLIPYSTMLVPLAVLLRRLNQSSAGAESYRKLDCWYWASVFSTRYDSAVDTKSSTDVRDIQGWVTGNACPTWLSQFAMQSLDIEADEPRSAVYRGVMCLVASKGAQDFWNDQSFQLHQCHDDHLFPRAVYGKTRPVNSVVNRTLISASTNRQKSDKVPSLFFPECRLQFSSQAAFEATLATHYILPPAYAALVANDFDQFTNLRRQALVKGIREKLAEAVH